MLLIHCNNDGLSSSWATSWKMSRASQVTPTEGYLASLKQVDAQYIHATQAVKPKKRQPWIVVTKNCWNKCACLDTEAFQLKKEELVSQLQEAYTAKDSKASRAGREAIRSCSGDARSDGCDIGRLPQVFLPKLERCALDTRTPHQGGRSSLEALPVPSL